MNALQDYNGELKLDDCVLKWILESDEHTPSFHDMILLMKSRFLVEFLVLGCRLSS
jgi:hypothetical protein